MTTYNTGNPIGSTDSRDRLDNTENFDVALNTLEPTWTDRLGVTRDSFEGRLEKGSFYRVGTFTAGYTLTNMRQTLEYSGHEYSWAGAFPKVVAAGATPATSGGIGAGAWVDRTDSTLRSGLSASDGEKLIGHCPDVATLRTIEPSIQNQKITVIGYYSDTPLSGGGNFIYDSADTTSADDGFLVFVTSSGKRWKRVKNFGVYNFLNAGARLDGAIDDSDAIISALSSIPEKYSMTGAVNGIAAISKRINLTSRGIVDCSFIMTAPSASIVMGGENPKLRRVFVDINGITKTFSSPLCGFVNLHLSNYAEIDGLEIVGESANSVGVFCSTRASFTTIKNSTINYAAWPILYNDAVSANRIVDGVDYSSATIGRGLEVTNCHLGAYDKTQVGDAVEVNCPSCRFTDVVITNNIVLKTATSTSNGIGFGVANADNVIISQNLLRNIAGRPGAIHTEKCTCVSIFQNTITDSFKGVGIGADSGDVTICGNNILNANEAIQILGVTSSIVGVKICDNRITDTINYPLQLVNVTACDVSGNIFSNITNASRSVITAMQNNSLGFTKLKIRNNTFIKTNGVGVAILTCSGTVTEVMSGGNLFSGISGSEIAGFIDSVRAKGLCQDHYGPQVATAGSFITTNGSPTGYINGTSGDIAVDIVNGVIYKHDGTSWVSKLS